MPKDRGAQLDEYLTTNQAVYDCHEYNCCHFTGGWVELLEGINPLSALPKNKPMLAVYKDLRRKRLSLSEMFTWYLQRQPIELNFIAIGDLALVPVRVNRYAGGICAGRTVVLLQVNSIEKYLHVPLEHAVRGWRIGC